MNANWFIWAVRQCARKKRQEKLNKLAAWLPLLLFLLCVIILIVSNPVDEWDWQELKWLNGVARLLITAVVLACSALLIMGVFQAIREVTNWPAIDPLTDMAQELQNLAAIGTDSNDNVPVYQLVLEALKPMPDFTFLNLHMSKWDGMEKELSDRLGIQSSLSPPS